jgi:hypothetical protein
MNLWLDAIDKLRSAGYTITLSEGGLRYALKGKNTLLRKQITPLIEVLKQHKIDLLNGPHFLIDQALREINGLWVAGTLEWMKSTRLSEWHNMIGLEEKINRLTFESDVNGLKRALSE